MRAILYLLVILVIAAIIAVYTGFINLSGDLGRAPTVSGGRAPSIDASIGSVDFGTKKTAVDVPTVGTKKEEVSVPTVSVRKPEAQ